MENTVYVNYVKFSNLNNNGEEVDVNHALHIFNDWNETVVEHTASFQQLKDTVHVGNVREYLKSFSNQNYYKNLLDCNGLYFNNTWVSIMDLERYSLLENVLGGVYHVAYR